MTSKPDPTETENPDDTPLSVTEQVNLVIGNARALANAEIGYLKARIGYSVQTGKYAMLFGIAALLAFSGAMIALVVGLLMTLAPYVGPGWTTVIVTAIFAGIGALCALQARAWFAKISFPEIDKEESDNA